MNRTEFETLRDLPGKRIVGDIRFSRRRTTQPNLLAEDIRIENSAGEDLRMIIGHNPEVGSTTINVYIPGTGPICRLDVNGPKHRPAGRSHKHSVQSERCPDRNLPDGVLDRSELSDSKIAEIFTTFCSQAKIELSGEFHLSQEEAFTTGIARDVVAPATASPEAPEAGSGDKP